MSQIGIDKFISRLQAIVKVTKESGDVTNCEAIGALEIIKLDLYQEILDMPDEEEDEKSCQDCLYGDDFKEPGVVGCPYTKLCDEFPFFMFYPKGE